jgi:hypothetical protein
MKQIAQLADYSNPSSLGSVLRARRRHLVSALISNIHAEKGRVDIIDLGGRELYWHMFGDSFLSANNCHITLVNLEDELPPSSSSMFTDVVGNACNLDFPDNSFDLVHSNSTIEHVGLWDQMEAFAGEVRRLAPRYYIQTPYFWCPIDPHAIFPFHHWLPLNVRTKLLLLTALGKYPKAKDVADATRIVQSAIMLDRSQMRFLFPDADLSFEWFGPMPKSILCVRDL